MSEPFNSKSPWRLGPCLTPTRSPHDEDPFADIAKMPTTADQRLWARRRLARIDALREQQRRNRSRER